MMDVGGDGDGEKLQKREEMNEGARWDRMKATHLG